MASIALYTPEVLALATALSQVRWDESLPMRGSARSRSCGSTLDLGLSTGDDGRIDGIGMRSQACAIGQAAAAIFAQAAVGKSADDIAMAHDAMQAWLAGEAPMPDWPGLAAIAAAREYPGRHGAILLAWQAASEALGSGKTDR